MALSPTMSYAADLTNSSGSNYADGVEGYVDVGEDTTQGKVSSKVSVDDVTGTTYADTSEAEVYATRNSIFSVIIPKVITLDGSTKSGDYQVAVKGDLSGSQEISVTPDENVTLHEQNAGVNPKADVIAGIVQGKTVWNQSEILQDIYDGTGTTKGTITADGITAGSWMGNFNFDIELTKTCTHDFSAEDTNNTYLRSEATCTDPATYYYKCTSCNEMGTTYYSSGSALGHDYSVEDASTEFLKSEATYDSPAVYYYKCSRCGEKGTATYTYGEKLVAKESVILADTGEEFNEKIKQLVNSSASYYDSDTTITNIEKTNVPPSADAKQIALTTEEEGLSTLATANDMIAYLDGTVVKIYTNAKKIVLPEDCSRMFYNFQGLTSLDITKDFDTSKVTNMSGMFYIYCSNLTSLDLSNFDTSNVTEMFNMFYGCSGLTSLNVSSFDTSNVTNMMGMFSGCSGLTSLDVSNFDTRNVTNMGLDEGCDSEGMFSHCSGLTSLNLSNFNMNSLCDMTGMFYECSNLSNITFAYDADFSNVFANWSFVYGCPSTITTNNETVNGWIAEYFAMYN